jgi:uncharacterized protein
MPAADAPVVVNTTPIITLSVVDRLDLLRQLFGSVIIPPAVRREVLAGGTRAGAGALKAASWRRETPLREPGRADLLTDLDRGEAEVLALALETGARLVILDERLGRWHARRLRLPLTGTLGVLLLGKEKGALDELGPLIQEIRAAGVWLAEPLVQRVLEMAGEA